MRRAALPLLFTALIGVMAAHEAEHVAQVIQKDAVAASCPNDCRGLLGFVFDIEWVHLAYNASIEAALLALVVGFRLWNPLLLAGVALQGYHVVEHVEKIQQWFANGRHSPTPGILGQHFSLVELHFGLNSAVFALVAGGYLALGLHRRLSVRTLAVAVAAAAVTVVGGALMYGQRPPTMRLSAGVHQGPIVLDRASRLVGEPGAVVRGRILVSADDVVVRDLDVEGSIEVRDSDAVLLERVRIRGVRADGIMARRSSVVVRNCSISASGPTAQGIDISFAMHGRPSLVERCVVTGGGEGIVAHLAQVRVHENRVTGTSLRGIAVTEMSMGLIEENEVSDALGIAIFCGDYSKCVVRRNRVSGTRPDGPSRSRAGFGIVAHYGAHAELDDNANEDGAAAFIGASLG